MITCNRCKSEVTGYQHATQFIFVDDERLKANNLAILSCGCEVHDYDLDIDYHDEKHKTRLLDVLMRDTLIEFDDWGPHNETWHKIDDEVDA